MRIPKTNTIPHREPVRDLLARHGSFTVYAMLILYNVCYHTKPIQEIRA